MLLFTRCRNCRNKLLSLLGHSLKITGLGTLGKAASSADCVCACIDPLVNIVYIYAAGGHELTLGKGSLEGADRSRSYDVAREDLDYVAYAVGTGSSLTKGAKTGDFAAVTAKAQEFVAAVAAARA